MASPKAKRNRKSFDASTMSNKTLQILFFIFIVSSVFLFYKFAGSKDDFSSEPKSSHPRKETAKKPGEMILTEEERKAVEEQIQRHREEYEKDFHILFMFTNVQQHPELKGKLSLVLQSIIKHGQFARTEMLHIHLVCDKESKNAAQEVMDHNNKDLHFHIEAHYHDADKYTKSVFEVVEAMQTHFGGHAYYKKAIFFLSMVMHRILPEKFHRIIQLDLDLKVTTNIRDLWGEFDYFSKEKVIGLAHENQPVYRHIFSRYRADNEGTTVGSPLPGGNPGFNSGVILLHLGHMRSSELYNQMLEADEVGKIASKYYFKGHLGDQDFFTLVSLEHPEMFHVLDCVWNRQLCQWWKTHGYEAVFDEYYYCHGDVKIWHGNCNTPLP